jgi:hypothetical protein
MEGMTAYQRYQALKLHFTSDYDFIKYSGKIKKISEASFLKRKDQYLFRKIERKYSDNELTNFFVANFVSSAGVRWVGDMSGPESEKVYVAWLKRMETFSYQLKEELNKIVDEVDDPKSLLKTTGEHPQLIKLYMGNKVSAETVIAFDIAFNVLDAWNKVIGDTIIWPEVYRQLKKYRPFVRVDPDNIKKIMRQVFLS